MAIAPPLVSQVRSAVIEADGIDHVPNGFVSVQAVQVRSGVAEVYLELVGRELLAVEEKR